MFSKLKKAFSKLKKDVDKESEEQKKDTGKKGFLESRFEKKLDKILEDFEDELIQNNVAYSITEKIINQIKESLLKDKKSSSKDIKEKLSEILKEVLTTPKQIELLEESNKKKPLILLFVGVNGVGKSTNMAKLAKLFQKNKKKVVFAAADTFRSAAIEQLGEHANKLKIKMIKHKYGADPAAVAFDAIKHAEAKGADAVMIDTAGRQHASEDLMKELKKIKKVASPDFTLLVIDSLTGSDAVSQSKYFSEKIGIDGIIVSKTDADERGGAIISAGYESGKPILFLGTGQSYKDLEKFNPEKLLKKIL